MDLVARAKDGDAEAFGTLYEEYAPAVYRLLRARMAGPIELIEDLTEDIFLKLFTKLDRYEERGTPFEAWLFRLARNHMVDYLRSWPRLATCDLDDAAEVVEDRTADAELASVVDRQALELVLARLTADQRQAIELRYFEGLSVLETAARMGKGEDAIKKLQARGLLIMRRLLVRGVAIGRSVGTARRRPVAA